MGVIFYHLHYWHYYLFISYFEQIYHNFGWFRIQDSSQNFLQALIFKFIRILRISIQVMITYNHRFLIIASNHSWIVSRFLIRSNLIRLWNNFNENILKIIIILIRCCLNIFKMLSILEILLEYFNHYKFIA